MSTMWPSPVRVTAPGSASDGVTHFLSIHIMHSYIKGWDSMEAKSEKDRGEACGGKTGLEEEDGRRITEKPRRPHGRTYPQRAHRAAFICGNQVVKVPLRVADQDGHAFTGKYRHKAFRARRQRARGRGQPLNVERLQIAADILE